MQDYAELETSALFDKLVEYTQLYTKMKSDGALVEEIAQCKQMLVELQWAITTRIKGESKDFIDDSILPSAKLPLSWQLNLSAHAPIAYLKGMSIKLYVDKIGNPASATQKMPTIRYNLEVLGSKLVDVITENILEAGNTTTFLAAGKYFCIIAINLEKKIFTMLFADLKNDDDLFYRVLQSGFARQDQQLRENAILVFNKLKQQYDTNYDTFELIEGEPPIEWNTFSIRLINLDTVFASFASK